MSTILSRKPVLSPNPLVRIVNLMALTINDKALLTNIFDIQYRHPELYGGVQTPNAWWSVKNMDPIIPLEPSFECSARVEARTSTIPQQRVINMRFEAHAIMVDKKNMVLKLVAFSRNDGGTNDLYINIDDLTNKSLRRVIDRLKRYYEEGYRSHYPDYEKITHRYI